MHPVVICLILGHIIGILLTSPGANAKRFDPTMVDPLDRRSVLDKNFMRFGRSSPTFKDGDTAESLSAETNKEDNFLRSMRGKVDNLMRFGRGKQNGFVRFGRGKQNSFVRFGRGNQDNFMRFGRGSSNNLMRFGRKCEDHPITRLQVNNAIQSVLGKMSRDLRGKGEHFMRFGKDVDKEMMSERTGGFSDADAMDSSVAGQPNQDKNTLLWQREVDVPKGKNFKTIIPSVPDIFSSGSTPDDSRLARFGRPSPNKDDGFMRFGRNSEKYYEIDPQSDLIPARLKRSLPINLPSEGRDNNLHISYLPEEHDEKMRILLSSESPTPLPLEEENGVVGFISAKLNIDSSSSSEYPAFPESSRTPNDIESRFSLFPYIDNPTAMSKKDHWGYVSHLR